MCRHIRNEKHDENGDVVSEIKKLSGKIDQLSKKVDKLESESKAEMAKLESYRSRYFEYNSILPDPGVIRTV